MGIVRCTPSVEETIRQMGPLKFGTQLRFPVLIKGAEVVEEQERLVAFRNTVAEPVTPGLSDLLTNADQLKACNPLGIVFEDRTEIPPAMMGFFLGAPFSELNEFLGIIPLETLASLSDSKILFISDLYTAGKYRGKLGRCLRDLIHFMFFEPAAPIGARFGIELLRDHYREEFYDWVLFSTANPQFLNIMQRNYGAFLFGSDNHNLQYYIFPLKNLTPAGEYYINRFTIDEDTIYDVAI